MITPELDDRPLALPTSVSQQSPPPFPFAASVAPLVASGLIWAITQSPFALVFAALSPVIAVASVVDGRWHARTARRRANAARKLARTRLEIEVGERHERERAARFALTPTARDVMLTTARIGRWSADIDRFACVTIGTGQVHSAVRLNGEPCTDEDEALLAKAASLDNAPIVADATLGIGLIGSPTLIRAVARGYLLQLAHTFSPRVARIAQLPATGWEWAAELPHCTAAGDDVGARIFVQSSTENSAPVGRGSDAIIMLAASLDELPTPCAVIIEVTGPCSVRILRHPDELASDAAVPELITEAQAAAYARRLAEHAAAAGVLRERQQLPATVDFGTLERGPIKDSGASLAVVVGCGRDGPLSLDLVTDGPHAVVGGTTGSGKSEFLTTWVAAMAAQYSPQTVGFLLVDFKGGSAFTALTPLPHCVGLITDLGHGEAERALKSLQAELQHRERVLARLGARDIAEAAGTLSRLVIVVDEFAAMLEAFPELHGLFVDIAARGRSLGVHTILCTQRPAGVVRDALLANCALRVSLRVNNGVDSVAVVGTDAASRLSAGQPGRCIVARDGVSEQAQVARASADDIAQIVRASPHSELSPLRRPWLDPLPSVILLETLEPAAAGSVVLGVEDVPPEQRQSAVETKLAGSHLLVSGVNGAGKSTLMRSIAQQWRGVVRTTCDSAEALWDALEWADDWCATHGRTTASGEPVQPDQTAVLLIDDLDALLGRMPQEYQDLALDHLVRILRDGTGAGISVVASVQMVTAALRAAAALFPGTVLLRQPSRQDHVLAGAPAALYNEGAGPGSGVWRSNRIQLAQPAAAAVQHSPRGRRAAPDDVNRAAQPPALRWADGTTILVTRSPATRVRSLRADATAPGGAIVDVGAVGAGALDGSVLDGAVLDGPVLDGAVAGSSTVRVSDGSQAAQATILVGSVDAWQARWGLFAALRADCAVVFDGCDVAQLRSLMQTREIPPLIAGPGRVWICAPDGTMRRARWAHDAS